MRLMARDLTPVQLLRAERIENSDYIGTKTEYKPYSVINAHIAPASDKYSVATYGERVSRMYNVAAEYGEDIKDGDKLVINGEECTVVTVLTYSSHITAVAERTGVAYGNGV